ncbi:MAG TPA: 2-dehydropantoate 2-reductase [Trebonia sp.]|nr:2-dehydropantoate 2-reductase [Trebonia sp.]
MARVAVLGAGGMGSAFAAYLARDGHDVQIIGRGGPHIEAIARVGLTVRPPTGPEYAAAVTARVHGSQAPPASADLLIVLTKTFDTGPAAESAAHALSPDGVVVSLQNGLGNDEQLATVFGGERALVGVTTVGAARQEPGVISLSAMTAAGRTLTEFGLTGVCAGAARGAELAGLLTAAGLPAVFRPNVEAALWGKLAMAVMSPVSAVLQRTVGQVWRHAAGRELVRQMFDEVVQVAAAEGVLLNAESAWTHAVSTFEGTGEHYTSMCTDVMLGRPTELHSMACEVARRGARRGLDLPAHQVVLRMLATMDVTAGEDQ